MLSAEVIAVGDELTSGQRLDTNSPWLSQRLAELGIQAKYHSTVGDQLSAEIEVFRRAIQRADVVIATGGLGPTADDLTRMALAEATARPLELRTEALDHIKQIFARRERPMPEQNRSQAMFPLGSRMIRNPHGTAPGIDLMFPRAGRVAVRIFALPGVPAEMREMWQDQLVPALTRLVGNNRRVIRHHSIKCFGVGESDLEAMLPDLIARGRHPSVGITVHQATITLRITSVGDSCEQCDELMRPTIETIHQQLGELIFGSGDDELQDAVARQLISRQQTLATAEWGTEGILASWLGQQVESAQFYAGGLVLRRGDAVPRLLGSPLDSSAKFVDYVKEVGRRLIAQFGTDYALVVGPAPSDLPLSGLPMGGKSDSSILLGLATPSEVMVEPKSFAGHPDIVRQRAAKMALNQLRLYLRSRFGSPPCLACPDN